ncbi:HD domain-containing phosphohydrolase [Pseudomonadota bacterium]
MEDTAKIKILTVDDDALLRTSIIAYLEDFGYLALGANNGLSGLALFRKEQPDLVLLDLRMPEMDGIELLPILVKEAPETPVIIISGMGTLDDSIQALRLGAWDYLTKPIHDFALLEHTMNRALDRANLIKENLRYKKHLEDEVKKRTQQLARVNKALHTLSAGNEALVRAENEAQLLDKICRTIQHVGGYTAVWVAYLDEKVLHRQASKGIADTFHETIKLKEDNSSKTEFCPLSKACEGEPLIIDDINIENICTNYRDWLKSYGIRSVFAFPLKINDEVFGLFVIYAKGTKAFGTEENKLLCELGDDLTYGIKTQRLREEHDQVLQEKVASAHRLEESMVQSIGAIAMTLEKRDPYTAGHQQRVAQIAVGIAQELGLDKQTIEGLKLGALIHDIGKVYVPSEILNRPGELTPEERELVKSHSEVGYDIMKDVTFPWPVAQMILQHHERFDGSGYPSGLKGEEIILEARIMAVADVVEAMSSHRPYRAALGIDAALEEIEQHSGTSYDDKVAAAVLSLFKEKGFVMKDEQSTG